MLNLNSAHELEPDNI